MRSPAHVFAPVGLASALVAFGCSSSTQPTQPHPVVLDTIASAPVSIENTAGVTMTQSVPGQSVYISPGVYSHLRYQWYGFGQEPAAFGTLYLLAEEFFGNPADLHSAPGVVASTNRIENNEYVFDTELRIVGNRSYWFYTNRSMPFVVSSHGDAYPMGLGYISSAPVVPFRYLQPATGAATGLVDANFRLSAFRR